MITKICPAALIVYKNYCSADIDIAININININIDIDTFALIHAVYIMRKSKSIYMRIVISVNKNGYKIRGIEEASNTLNSPCYSVIKKMPDFSKMNNRNIPENLFSKT